MEHVGGGSVTSWGRGVAAIDAVDAPVRPTAEVPSALGRGVLLFAFLALAEYWLAPPILGVTNFAGVWSGLGLPLFLLFAGSLLVFAAWPLRPHLRAALATRSRWTVLIGLWSGVVLLTFFATHVLQLGEGGGGDYLGTTTVYGAFGQGTGLAFSVGAIAFTGTLVPTDLVVVGLLGFLWASAVVVGLENRSRGCAVPSSRRSAWTQQLGAVGVWGPFGFLSSCSACTPAYLAVIGSVAPGVAANGYASLPLVPWIGLAGLLYLLSFALVLRQLRRATRSRDPPPADAPEGVAA